MTSLKTQLLEAQKEIVELGIKNARISADNDALIAENINLVSELMTELRISKALRRELDDIDDFGAAVDDAIKAKAH